MVRNLFAAICAVLFTLAAGTASAQTISQPNGGFGAIGGTSMGQTFTATVTGKVTEIQVRPRTNVFTTVYFFNGTGSGAADSNASAVSSQAVTLVDQGSHAAGFQTIVLATPLPVVAGNVYAFAFAGSGQMSANMNAYAGGNTLSNYNSQDSSSDLAFTVTQVAATPAAVPTMTEWAMILFGMILAGGAALYIQRRRQVA